MAREQTKPSLAVELSGRRGISRPEALSWYGNQNMGRTLTSDALSLGWVTTKPQSVPPNGGNMDRDTKHFAIVAAIVGILLTLTMLYYANKSDKLVDDYSKGTLTLNIEKTGWEQGRDAKGNIIYKQKNYECVRVK